MKVSGGCGGDTSRGLLSHHPVGGSTSGTVVEGRVRVSFCVVVQIPFNCGSMCFTVVRITCPIPKII